MDEKRIEELADRHTDTAWYAFTFSPEGLQAFARDLLAASIADTAGANCATCGAVGTVTSTKARCTLCGMFADTAGAKPVTGPWPTDAMNAAGMRELAAFHKSRGDTVDAIYLAMSAAAPPAPSVADAKCMCSGLGPCEKLSNCRKAPSVADAGGAKAIYQRQHGLDGQWVDTSKAEYEYTPVHRRRIVYLGSAA